MSKPMAVLVTVGIVALLINMNVTGGDVGGLVGDIAGFFLDMLGGAADSTETVG